MTGRTAVRRILASLLSSKGTTSASSRLLWAYPASAQCGLTTSLKVSPNGVAHWACGDGASPQFCAAVPARHTVGATLARTLGLTKHAYAHQVSRKVALTSGSCRLPSICRHRARLAPRRVANCFCDISDSRRWFWQVLVKYNLQTEGPFRRACTLDEIFVGVRRNNIQSSYVRYDSSHKSNRGVAQAFIQISEYQSSTRSACLARLKRLATPRATGCTACRRTGARPSRMAL
jgi:hypothetical protein